jgi:hypothetical protein
MITFFCLRFETPSTWSPGPRIYNPQVQGDPVLSPALGFLSVAFYDSQGYGGGNMNPTSHTDWPICYALIHKFEAEQIQNIAQQTFEEAVVCVLH